MQRLRKYRLGVWLGVLAVAFYAWLPGHFAGHVAHTALDALAAIGDTQVEPPSHHRAHHPAGHDEHQGGTCPICAAAAASAAPAAAMLPVLAGLPAPRTMAPPLGRAEARTARTAPSSSPYAPRAPPRAG